MNEQEQLEALFMGLRMAMKAKGATYAKLAKAIDVSELSIKRMFKDKDCKMSRLLDICSFLDINLDDLLQINQRTTKTPQYLPEEMEQALSQDKHLFTLFIFLISQLDIEQIKELWGMEDHQLYLHLRKLEELGFIELSYKNQIRFLVSLPIRWRLNGPLGKTLQKVNENYIAHAFQHALDPEQLFSSVSRLMTPSSANKLQQQLQSIHQEFDTLATQDQLFFKPEELKLYKLVIAMGTFPVQDMIPFKPHS